MSRILGTRLSTGPAPARVPKHRCSRRLLLPLLLGLAAVAPLHAATAQTTITWPAQSLTMESSDPAMPLPIELLPRFSAPASSGLRLGLNVPIDAVPANATMQAGRVAWRGVEYNQHPTLEFVLEKAQCRSSRLYSGESAPAARDTRVSTCEPSGCVVCDGHRRTVLADMSPGLDVAVPAYVSTPGSVLLEGDHGAQQLGQRIGRPVDNTSALLLQPDAMPDRCNARIVLDLGQVQPVALLRLWGVGASLESQEPDTFAVRMHTMRNIADTVTRSFRIHLELSGQQLATAPLPVNASAEAVRAAVAAAAPNLGGTLAVVKTELDAWGSSTWYLRMIAASAPVIAVAVANVSQPSSDVLFSVQRVANATAAAWASLVGARAESMHWLPLQVELYGNVSAADVAAGQAASVWSTTIQEPAPSNSALPASWWALERAVRVHTSSRSPIPARFVRLTLLRCGYLGIGRVQAFAADSALPFAQPDVAGPCAMPFGTFAPVHALPEHTCNASGRWQLLVRDASLDASSSKQVAMTSWQLGVAAAGSAEHRWFNLPVDVVITRLPVHGTLYHVNHSSPNCEAAIERGLPFKSAYWPACVGPSFAYAATQELEVVQCLSAEGACSQSGAAGVPTSGFESLEGPQPVGGREAVHPTLQHRFAVLYQPPAAPFAGMDQFEFVGIWDGVPSEPVLVSINVEGGMGARSQYARWPTT